MITEIRLAQIKDNYQGDIGILLPLVNALKKDFISMEIILVKRAFEWLDGFQIYDPLPKFEYLIKAAKLAYPKWEHQVWLNINCEIVEVSEDEDYCVNKFETLLESSRLKVLFSKGSLAVVTYSQKLAELHNELSNLKKFSELIQGAEIDNDY
jgi:hypothetical protein